jgi:RNA polymerase sigma factor (sigma-70 family)
MFFLTIPAWMISLRRSPAAPTECSFCDPESRRFWEPENNLYRSAGEATSKGKRHLGGFAVDHHRLASPDLERVFRGEAISGLSEWQLLARYLEHRDELAFEALVARHGPMVLGTCRRMLSGESDVDDAFQATFLVLVRRAGALGPRDAIGPWLHGVAARVSMRARSQAARRRRLETIAPGHAARAAPSSDPDGELADRLDQEVNRLPAKYRSPIVLCYLEGHTHEEAARQLNWPLGTVKGRLARARDLLRARLLRRGIAPSLALLGLSFAREASAAVEREVLNRTVSNCMKVTLRQAPIDGLSASIASLVKGALSAMIVEKLKWVGLAGLAAGLALAGATVMARQPGSPRPKSPAQAKVLVDNRQAPSNADPAENPGAKPTAPDSASSELDGLRTRLIQAAKREWATTLEDFQANRASLDRIYQASRRVMSAEEDGRHSVADQAAASAHADRMRDVARIENAKPSRTDGQVSQVNAYSAEAELWRGQAAARFRANAKAAIRPSSGARAGKDRDRDAGHDGEPDSMDAPRPGQDPRSQQIIAKLGALVPMKFVDETPLEDVIKHIRQATVSSEMPSGIPIYVDPIGLSEADKTNTSTVHAIDLEGVPLRRTLQLALAQIDLGYFIVDGMLYITSLQSANNGSIPPTMPTPSLRMQKLEKAERGELTVDEMKDLVEMLKCQSEIEAIQAAKDHVWGGVGPDPRLAAGEAKANKELADSLVKLTHSLLEELKELRKSKQSPAATTPAAKEKAPAAKLQ